MTIPPKAIQYNPYEIPLTIFTEVLKVHMEAQKSLNGQSNPKQKAILEISQYLSSNYATGP
jgi:hypothetical protein